MKKFTGIVSFMLAVFMVVGLLSPLTARAAQTTMKHEPWTALPTATSFGTLQFSKKPVAKDHFILSSINTYTTGQWESEGIKGWKMGVDGEAGWNQLRSMGGNGYYAAKIVNGTLEPGGEGSTVDGAHNYYYLEDSMLDWKVAYSAGTIITSNGTVTTIPAGTVLLNCVHEDINADFQYQPGYVSVVGTTKDVYCYIVGVHEISEYAGYVLMAILSPTDHAQCGVGEFKIPYELAQAELSLTKSSSCPEMTTGNDAYSTEGITYGVYTSDACTTLAKDVEGQDAILRVRADGSANTLKLSPGTYYVKEGSVPDGCGFLLDTVTIKPVTLKSGETATVSFTDVPLNDPAGVVINKAGPDGSVREGADLSGAQYTLRFYAGQYTKASLPNTPDASWVIETKRSEGGRYRAFLGDGYVVAGDGAKYGKDSVTGYYKIPLGTLTIEETKAPAGFTISGSTMQLMAGNGQDATDGIMLVNLVDENSMVMVRSGNQTADARDGFEILQKEQELLGRLTIQKAFPAGVTVSLAGFRFTVTGTADSGAAVSLSGVTNETGQLIFENVPFGTYTVKEALTPEQAKVWLGKSEGSVTVGADPVTFRLENSPRLGRVEVEKSLPEGAAVSLAGFTFRLLGTSLTGIPVDMTVITNEEGKASFEDVPFGSYEIREELTDEQAKIWQEMAGAKVTVDEAASTVRYRLQNQLKTLPLSVVKTSEDDFISGIPFILEGSTAAGSPFKAQAVTDDTGRADFGAVPYGSYRLTEAMEAPDSLRYAPEGPWDLMLDEETASPYEVTAQNRLVKIGTRAQVEGGGKTAPAGAQSVTIIDLVTYQGLTIGAEYTVSGTLMLKDSGQPLMEKGRPVTAALIFTATASEGFVELKYSFDASLIAGKSVVVFESLYREGVEIALHADLQDENQTVNIPKKPVTPNVPDTGDDFTPTPYLLTFLGACMGAALIIRKKRG